MAHVYLLDALPPRPCLLAPEIKQLVIGLYQNLHTHTQAYTLSLNYFIQ